MLLIIDAGNTRTKWAVFNANGVILYDGACLNKDFIAIHISPMASCQYERIIVSNVAGKDHESLLCKKLSDYNLPLIWVSASTHACGVNNQYVSPEQLGSDRWAALIAAWHIQHASCIVVNAGTAVTIDALSSHQNNHANFIGGAILPGLNLMQQSLGDATAQLASYALNAQVQYDDMQIFAKNTSEAIFLGAIYAIIGAIKLMSDAMQLQTQKIPHIILSGGNAKTIHHYLLAQVTNPILIVDNLVLKGLFLIEKSTQSKPS